MLIESHRDRQDGAVQGDRSRGNPLNGERCLYFRLQSQGVLAIRRSQITQPH